MVTNQVVGVAYDGEGGGNFFKSVLDSLGDIFEDDEEVEEGSDKATAKRDSRGTPRLTAPNITWFSLLAVWITTSP